MPDRIQLIFDDWLSAEFGHHVLKLLINHPGEAKDEEIRQALGETLMQDHVFIYSKIPVDALACANILQKYGFRLVDTNIIFEKQIANKDQPSNLNAIRFARPKDKDEVGRIALHNFVFSRFHLDPKIAMETANEIKAAWAKNFFSRKRGDVMVVSDGETRLSGFLQLVFDNKTLIVDLIAVDREKRRENIANNMINFAQKKIDGFEFIRLGTQVANFSSMRLCENSGFRIRDAFYVFHYHN